MLFATQLFLRVAVLNATSLVPVVLLVKRNADMSHVAGVMANVAWSLAKTSFIFTLLQLVTGKLRWLLWFIMVTMNVTVATWVPLFENPCGPRSHLPCMTGRQALNFAVFASAQCISLFSLFGLPPIVTAMEDHMAAAPQHKGQNWYMCGHEHGIWVSFFSVIIAGCVQWLIMNEVLEQQELSRYSTFSASIRWIITN
ncbi:hypothetical protein Landi51_06766 [Colletotrichum acutatum]